MSRYRPDRRRARLARARSGRSGRRAFSLLELLIAIAIMLAIGGLVVINLMPAKDEADIKLTIVQIDSFGAALDKFRLDLKRWPSEDEGIAVLWNKGLIEEEDDEDKWIGPYLKTPSPKDTWGSEWIYRAPSEILEGAPYDIISLGPDAEEDTEDDIHNHTRMMNAEGEIDEAFDDFTPADAETGG